MSKITQYILENVKQSGLTGTGAMVFKTLLVLLHLEKLPVLDIPTLVLQLISELTSGVKKFPKYGNSKKKMEFEKNVYHFGVSGRGACDRWAYEGRWGEDNMWTNFRSSVYRSKGSRVST